MDAPEIENGSASTEAQQQLLESRTILIIEDEKALRANVAAMLRKRGLVVIEAEDGNTGVELFLANRSKIEAVLLDMTLPGKPGPTVFEELQRIDPAVKVIVTSAYGEEHVRKLLHGLPALGYIQKPYHLDEVQIMLRNVLVDAGTVGHPGA